MRSRAIGWSAALACAAALAAWVALRGDAPQVEATVPDGAGELALAPREESVSIETPPAERDSDPARGPALERSEGVNESVAPAPELERARLSLYGFVIPPEGRALDREVGISAVDHLGVRQSAQAGSDGAYAFAGLAPGRYWISAGSTRSGRAEREVELAAAAGDRRLDLQLEMPPEILIQVVDREGAPLGGFFALPIATLEPPGQWFTDVIGSFNNTFGVGQFWQSGFGGDRLPEGFIGRLLLDVDPPVYVSLLNYQRVIETQRVEPGERELRFVIDRDSPLVKGVEVRFRFVDADSGEPVETTGASLEGCMMRMAQPTDGEYRLPSVAPGWYEVNAMAQGYERGRRRVLVDSVASCDLGAIPLGRASSITGLVVDDAGRGVAVSMTISVLDEATGEPVRHFVGLGARSGADGSFEIGGLSRAVYALRISGRDAPWAAASERVDLRSGSAEHVRIELARGVPLVVRPSGEAVRDVHYRIRDAAGEVVIATQLWSRAPFPLQLAPGRYTVEAWIGEGEPVHHAIAIASEPVELALP